MDVIGLDSTIVKGSHGRLNSPADSPVLISQQKELPATIAPDAICQVLLRTLGAPPS